MSARFRDRARREALRYGADPWVFVRELIQNARDAEAGEVAFSVAVCNGVVRVDCRDDGVGMALDHARRYLFSLYASSKERDSGAAGCFGVGFWSVLRFEPSRITVRSWPRRGESWEVELSGDLDRAQVRRAPPRSGTGTEVVLEHPGSEDVEPMVSEAARNAARHLRRRGRLGSPLPVSVNGRCVSAAFTLAPPSLGFKRGRLRGVVALREEPAFELLSRGLHVRRAASLEELLSVGSRSEPVQWCVGRLAPQGLLDGDLEVLLARGDARPTRPLRRLVALARQELGRLLERQLALVRPEPLGRRLLAGVRRLGPAAITAGLAGFGLALLLGVGPRVGTPGRVPVAEPQPGAEVGEAAAAATGATLDALIPYRDLATVYRGARTEGATTARRVGLRYAPEAASLYFAALRLEGPDERAPAVAPFARYEGPACAAGCVSVELLVDDGPGPLRLPLPTGHRLDPGSVLLEGQAVTALATAADEPLVVLPARTLALVRYRSGPSSAPPVSAPPPPETRLPPGVASRARQLRGLPVEERVAALLPTVRALVRYSQSPDVAAADRAAHARGVPFVERVLSVGAGDCDVQNGLLVLLLREASAPARLAVGYMGIAGRALPGIHAWAEYRDEAGRWHVADASSESPGPAETRPPMVAVAAVGLLARPSQGATDPMERKRVPAWVWLATVGTLGLGAGGLLLRRTRRELRLDPSADVTDLLRAALERPEAFDGAPAVLAREVVPLLGGAKVALNDAHRLSSAGRLFASRQASALARRAADAGLRVLDTRSAEGRAVAEALGAVDLDVWDAVLAGSRTHPLLDAAAAELHRLGEVWDVRLVDRDVGAGVLDLGPSLARRGSASSRRSRRGSGVQVGAALRAGRIVVVSGRDPSWGHAVARYPSRPHEALFTVLDMLAARLAWSPQRRARLLTRPAARAILEAVP